MVRINIGSTIGKSVREEYNVATVPTFIAFDQNGNEVFRQGGRVPRAEKLFRLIN